MRNSDHKYDGVYQSLITRAYYRLEGEHVLMRLYKFEPWVEPPFRATTEVIIGEIKRGFWIKVGDL
ncbi:hypothetical protein NDI13_000597 [Escherichia coli]|uniref:hypothetical protein n=1 Tax=Escherichia coli TaxID=562 RepID=UPI0018B054F3|nr:hypothetical protein [Escherichia coli]EFA1899464.1 hypothetical protein [Escherichia coli]EJH4232129.1 hypothetical protein [Escherichia coli]EJH7227253.1 hypothetical protein [Escherichia coli]EJL9682957.1 hypothetical protein [Escherichia coli]MBF9525442.1 hypothetical protein [Escherichia coli]